MPYLHLKNNRHNTKHTPYVSLYSIPGLLQSANKFSPIKADERFLVNKLNDVCAYFNVTPEQVVSNIRKRDVVLVRHIFCFICHYGHGEKSTHIAISIRRDHTTVLHACGVVKDQLQIGNKDYVEPITNLAPYLLHYVKKQHAKAI